MTNDTTPTCCGDVIKNVANHKEFWVCQKCKKEPAEKPMLEISIAEIDERIREAFSAYAANPSPQTPYLGPCQHRNAVWDASGMLQCPDCNRFWTP